MRESPSQANRSNRAKARVKIDFLIHDLKVPLAVIEAGLISLLERTEKYGPLTEKQKKVLTRALRNTKITKTLVNDALELGRSRQGIVNPTNFGLSTFVERALVEIFDLTDGTMSERIQSCTDLSRLKEELEEKGIYLDIDETMWCEQVCLDEAKLTQILRNLLNNALKYRKKRIELGIAREEKFLCFHVKDDGEGIPSSHHSKIFDSYFQMDGSDDFNVRGHGLGLAGVMALVEDMGGELSLESDTGQGARFIVRLPLEQVY